MLCIDEIDKWRSSLCESGSRGYWRVEWNEVATLDETERGEGGFGHTGK